MFNLTDVITLANWPCFQTKGYPIRL